MKNKVYIWLPMCVLATALCVSMCLGSANENIASNGSSFSDVKETDWFYENVKKAENQGIMNGTGDGKFSPYDTATRGMIVTTLWRMEGEPQDSGIAFTDVSSDSYYYDAVIWAANNQIVNGYSAELFGPNDSTTREQMITILHRYADFKDCKTTETLSLDAYEDKNQISGYAVEAFEWGYANGIIFGTSETTLSPKDPIQRCQIASILMRFIERFDVVSHLESQAGNDESGTPDENENPKETSSSIPSNEGGSGGGAGGGGNGPTRTSVPDTQATPETTEETMASPEPDDHETDIAEGPVIELETIYGNPGDVVKAVVDLQRNPGILGMVLSLEYDESAMRLLNAENGNAVSDVLTLTVSNELSSGVKFVWDGLELKPDDIKDGTLLVLEFEILDSATEGKRYPLQLSYDSGAVVDNNLEVVNPQIHQGYMEVTVDTSLQDDL